MEEIDPWSDEVLDWLPEEDARTLQSGSVHPACVAIRFALPSMPDLFANQLLAFALHDGAPVLRPRPDDDLDSAMLHYRVHGWTVIPSLLSADFLSELGSHADALAAQAHVLATSESGIARGEARACINSLTSPLDPVYMHLWSSLWTDNEQFKSLLHAISRESYNGSDRVQVDHICGGDSVRPGAPAQSWHSDWCGAMDGCVAVSVYTRDFPSDAAPMAVISRSAGFLTDRFGDQFASEMLVPHAIHVNPPAGALLIRDVSCWHRGSSNASAISRVLPCLRFLTSRALYKYRYKPVRVMSEGVWDNLSEGCRDLTQYLVSC